MKVAVTKGTLRVPPTYFALAHAEQMGSTHNFEVFTLVSDIQSGAAKVPVKDFVPAPRLGFRRRELVMPAFMPRMVKAIQAFGPDVIHQHFGTWAIPATNASKRAGVPMITTLHGADVFAFSREPSTMMSRWHHRNMSAASHQSSRLLAVSSFLASTAVASGVDAKKLEVHYQGIDTDYFTPSQHHSGGGTAAPLLLFVGGLSERKGIRDLISASMSAQSRSPHRLVIAGDGELREDVLKLIGSSRDIELVGPQDRHSIRTLMREARALVVPSRTHNGWREAAGLVALEAAACGTPVIANDCGGLREMVVDGATGVLVGEDQPKELAEAIHQMVKLPLPEYSAMSSAARKFAVEERSLRKSCAELAHHYDDVV